MDRRSYRAPGRYQSDTLIGIAELNDAKFRIDTIGDNNTYIRIRNVAGGNNLGVDSQTDGATVYVDKASTNATVQFRIVLSGILDTKSLQALLDEAIPLFESTKAGNETGEYPAAIRSKLEAQIEYSQSIIDDEAAGLAELITQEEVDEAVTVLKSVMDEYKNSKNPFKPSAYYDYYIRQLSGFYFTASATIATATYSADQKFRFEEVSGQSGVYYIKSTSTAQYMMRDTAAANGWSITWVSEIPTDVADYLRFKIVPNEKEDYYTIVCQATHPNRPSGSCLGSDATNNGSSVFLDKTGTTDMHLWMIISTAEVTKIDLQEAIASVETFLETAERGNDAGQYPAKEYDALIAALLTAQTIMDNSGVSQTDIDNATTGLTDALAACKAAEVPFKPETGVDYYIIHHSGFYLGEYSDAENDLTNKLAIFSNEGGANQVFRFVEVADTVGVYNITVNSLPGMYLTRKTDPEADDYATIWADDPASPYAQFSIAYNATKDYLIMKCIQAGPTRSNSFLGTDSGADKASVWIDKTGNANNHYWTIVKKSESGINGTTPQENVLIYSNNSTLTISELTGSNTVSVYTLSGQLVSKAMVNDTAYTTGQLAKGVYIIVVNGNSSYQGKAVVR